MAFALGYGGTVASGPRFAFDAAALDGLSALADIARRFGAGAETVPTAAGGIAGMADQYAIAFDTWTPPSGAGSDGGVPSLSSSLPSLRFGKEWAWARVPRFPVPPVVTTALDGEGLTLSGSAAPADLPPAVQALLWLFAPGAQAALRAYGLPPVRSDVNAQGGFWGMWGPSGQAVGDWRRFTPYDAGWPGPAGSAPMAQALAGAVAEPARLGALVVAAARQMSEQAQAAAAG